MPKKKEPDTGGKRTRQKNGTGSFKHRKDGKVEYRVYLGIGADGKPWRPSFYGDTEAEALQAYQEWLKKSSDAPIERVHTVKEWAEKWLELYKRDKISYKSFKNYELYVDKHIIPAIGKLRLEAVRPAHIAQLYRAKKDMSASALRHIQIALNGIFETAIENRFCSENPVTKVDLPEKTKIKRTPKAFTVSEITKIINFAPQHKSGNLVLALLHTAMRMGEMSALTWSNVHADQSYIEITQTVEEVENDDKEVIIVGGKEKHKKKYAIKDIPKGNKDRIFVLTPDGAEFFQSLPETETYVFPSLSGDFMTPNQFREQYLQFFKALNKQLDADKVKYLKEHPDAKAKELEQFEHVRSLSPHKCRHTYATHSIRSGINMRILQEQLGHQQVTTTEIYTTVDIEDRKSNISHMKY